MYTSVNPQQCSSASISIAVGNPPLAVNDSLATKINTPVSGNVSTNDSNFPGGTFTFGNPGTPIGTISANSTTGQFTFTPATGFIGTAQVPYTLCSQYSPPCATAFISFTVYPELIANPETISTVLNTTVSGNVTANDTGMQPGGTYSVNLAPLSANVGTINITTSNGQYTFTPATGFIGSATTNYTLSQQTGTMQLQSSVATITVIVNNPGSPIGIAKSISNSNFNTNGTIDLTYKVVVKNYSAQTLTSVSVSDDLGKTFPSPSTFTVTGTPTLNTSAGSQLALNNSYKGSGPDTLLTLSSSSLAAGRSDTILFVVKVDPHNMQFTYNNSAKTILVTSSATLTDLSADGLNPDPDGDGDPGNNNTPTTFTYNVVKIGIAKSASASEINGNGCNTITFKFTIKNYGTGPIHNLAVVDNLNATFNAQATYTILSPPTSVNGFLTPNSLYNGSSNTNLLSGNSQLNGGATDTLVLKVKYCTNSKLPFYNTATASGNSLPNGGFTGSDASTNGTNPDLNNNNNASDPGEDIPTPFVPGEDFLIPQGFSPNGDGINDRFEIKGLSNFPQMEVNILNRWGNIVYTKKQYDNSWGGEVSEGLSFGTNDLPEGTYFYIIDLGNGQTPLKGFVYINRAVK